MLMNLGRAAGLALLAAAVLTAGCAQERLAMQTDPNKAVIDAKVALLSNVDHSDEVIRARALEGVALFLVEEHGRLLVSALDDESPKVRTTAALAIGDIRYEPAEPRLREMIGTDRRTGEQYNQVIPAVVYALYRLGEPQYMAMLGELLLSDYVIIRTNTAEVLGKLGDKRAVDALRQVIWKETDQAILLRFHEAMARLGDAAAAAALEGYTKGRYVDQRIQGLLALTAQNPARARPVLLNVYNKRDEQPALRLVAAGCLAQLGVLDDNMYRYAAVALMNPAGLLEQTYKLKSAGAGNEDAILLVQRHAAWALGWMKPYTEGVDLLMPHLQSSDPSLQILAAMSVLRLLPSVSSTPIPERPVVPEQPKPVPPSQNGVEEPLVPELPPVQRPRLETSDIEG